jgi:integrase
MEDIIMANKKLNKNLYQDSDSGIWYFQKKVRGLDKSYKFSLETTSVLEARKKRDEYLLEIAVNGKINRAEDQVQEIDKSKLFGQIAMEWAEIKKTKVSKSTMDEYRKDMNNIILPQFGNQTISSITTLEIEKFISRFNCSGKRKINIMTPFRDVFNFSKKHKLIEKNPMEDVDTLKKTKSDISPLNLDEVKIFLETVPTFYKPLFTFLFFTGVRFGEAAALKWKRVDFKNRRVYIRKTLVRGEYKEPKTKSSIRYVRLSAIVVEALKRQKEQTFGKSEFVFLNRSNRNIHQNSMNYRIFKPTLKKAGLSMDRSCKDTRSSYITNSIDNNERIGFVQNQVGHETTKMIIDHYYRHIPAPDDGKGLEDAFSKTLSSEG